MAHNSAVAPFTHDAGTVGVLLSHGFTGSPASMRPWGEYLARHGHSVRIPLLPGHGTTWQDMSRTTWQRWYAVQQDAVLELRKHCDQVFVFGLSMGGTLALQLAAQMQDAVSGVVVVNPLVHRLPPGSQFAPYVHRVVPSIKAIGNDIRKPGMNEHSYSRTPLRAVGQLAALSRTVVGNVRSVTQPILIFTSVEDHVVDPRNSEWLAANVGSADVSSVALTNSYHVATLDHDADLIFETSLAFVRRVSEAS